MKPNSYLQIESLSPLYEDVQQSGIFTDSKYFVDALPKSSVTNILERYAVDNKQTSFSLLKFIRENFILPQAQEEEYSSANKSIDTHLHELWNVLQRNPDETGGTLIPLPYPYIVREEDSEKSTIGIVILPCWAYKEWKTRLNRKHGEKLCLSDSNDWTYTQW